MNPHSTDTPPTDRDFRDASRDEFPEGAAEFTDEVSRRRFLTIMGASAALAGAAGCIRPAPSRTIVPYSTQPDEVTPGVPTHYASTFPLGGYGTGVLVRSNEGRPTKIEPNPEHPSSAGGAGVYALGSLLDLYDPDRSKSVTRRGQADTYDAAIAALRKQLEIQKPKRGSGLRILSGTVTSPSLAAAITKLLEDYPDARWAQYEAMGRDSVREGARKAFGRPLNVAYDFGKADVVLALDCDFLTAIPGADRYSRDFADRRKIRQDGKTLAAIHGEKKDGEQAEGVQPDALNRLYVVESMPSCAGSVADHRLAIPSSQVEAFARLLAAELGVTGAPAGGALPAAAAQVWQPWIKALADDLKRAEGKSVVVAGDHQPASLHTLVHAINDRLKNFGKTVFLSAPVEAPWAQEAAGGAKKEKAEPLTGRVIDLKKLTGELAAKQVEALLVLGVNAAYTAPADIPFAKSVNKANVPFSLHLGSHVDETAVVCEWHVNEAHYLEAWGDVRGHDGTVGLQQPLIAPLYNGKSALELFADATGSTHREGLDILRAYWREQFAAQKREGEFEPFWQESVRAGFMANSAPAPESKVGLDANWAADAPALTAPGADQLELNFRLDPTIHDGRFANNGWLQELPKPVTRMTWDNAAYMSEATAKNLKLPEVVFRWTGGEHGRSEVPVVELKVKVDGVEKAVKAPVWVLPGHADNSVTVHLGYGRSRAGRVNHTPDEPNAEGESVRGFNANTLRSWVAGKTTGAAAATVAGLGVADAKKTYFLACVQARSVMVRVDPLSGHEWDRKPVRWGTLTKQPEDNDRYKGVPVYKDEPAFAKVPPASAGEWHEIEENVPQPRHGSGPNEGSGHTHDDKHALTMYYPSDELTPGLRPEQKRRWAMAIDLNACTGCSACTVACVGENNTPVVGKYEVTRGRAMHWINVDRYYAGTEKNPDAGVTLFQPRMCVQCENAPCEVVCPVGATVHSADGLNDMVYNRCVGTRYCSNNCPYKVRRFNFLTFQDWDTTTLKLGRNPDVSVRSRGVMEKCTFCVQRIRGAEIVAEREHRPIRDGEIVTACQSACPSGAIVFGDLNDPHSEVSRWKHEPRNYGLLAELNTRPRLTHLAVVRNPNPAMPKGA